MSRQNGYSIVIRAFIPAPKNDFKAQAAAARLADEMTREKAIPEDFMRVARIIDVKGAYGSMAEEEAPAEKPAKEPPAAEVTELPTGRRKGPAAA